MSQEREILFLSERDVRSLITMKEAIEVVEQAFKDYALGKAQQLMRRYLTIEKYKGKIGFMPAYIDTLNVAGIKIVGAYEENPKKYGLPRVIATTVLLDPETGLPTAIMDGTYLTMVRTGALGAVAAKYLARKDSEIAGIIGAGVQGMGQLLGLIEVLNIKRVLVYDIVPENADKFVREVKKMGLDAIRVESAEAVVKNVDVLATATTSEKPVVMKDWAKPGLHINSVGVSTAGKQEIDTELFKISKLVVDDFDQTSKIGGINVPISQGILTKNDVYCEIGDLILGRKPGRISKDEITIFVTSGLAIQDVSVSQLVYWKAKKMNMGVKVKL
jgi:alanine dehydrogenase